MPKKKKEAQPATKQQRPTKNNLLGNFVNFFSVLAGLIIFTALISYHHEDITRIPASTLHNLLGPAGAYVAHYLYLLFGMAAYTIPTLLFLTGLRHLFVQRLRYSTELCAAGSMIIIGLTLLFGTVPNLTENPVTPDISVEIKSEGLKKLLNNREPIPAGGVIGQRFCAPLSSEQPGWLTSCFHKIGCQIIALLLFIAGLVIIYFKDWRGTGSKLLRFMFITLKRLFAKLPEDLTESAPKEKKSKKTEVVATAEEPPAPTQKERGGLFAGLKNRPSKEQTLFSEEELPPAPAPAKTAPVGPPPMAVTPADHIPHSTGAMDMPGQTRRQPTAPPVQRANGDGTYTLPDLNLLSPTAPGTGSGASPEEINRKKMILQQTVESFKVDAEVTDVTAGPRVTLFEIVPAPGVNLKKITGIEKNIAMDLKAHTLRILAPIPGKSSVGIEVPNEKASPVELRALLEEGTQRNSKMQIPLTLGRNISGSAVFLDLAKAPHLLIAGATGSGKSVCMNTIIASMLYKFTPDELKLILVDPKVVEFKNYENLPHLVTPVVNDPSKVTMALHWAVKEMERRYRLLADAGVKNLESFNNRPKTKELKLDSNGQPIPDKLPILVIIIDELADIMMTAKGDVETSLARIAQLGRASGIHAIIATQRPSVNVITGIIKANFPTRIAFKVTSAVDSRTILDSKGADQLLGQGDMLFNPPGASTLERIQGAFVKDNELENVVEFVASQKAPDFDESVFASAEDTSNGDFDTTPSPGFTDEDLTDADEELIQQAIRVIMRDQRATTSYIQRSLRIGYNRAATIIETLEKRGVVGPQIGSSPREILIGSEPE